MVRKWSPFAAAATDSDPVRDAYRALAQVNRVYTGVIKRSKRCADLLAALYGACGVGYGKDAALPGQQTLTCEV